jgi:hypothetical protein
MNALILEVLLYVVFIAIVLITVYMMSNPLTPAQTMEIEQLFEPDVCKVLDKLCIMYIFRMFAGSYE